MLFSALFPHCRMVSADNSLSDLSALLVAIEFGLAVSKVIYEETMAMTESVQITEASRTYRFLFEKKMSFFFLSNRKF
ncbi:hypothetical protein ES332_A12G248000v1 [Gossypium tomentosum]|uniref:Uncharacterized protein n=1 Tax=Gossypium tomentosum TaxID=34277 RepID=A0A5D2N116_GOSTO|nr:hypothetical protein ES332_A12G248000v1 [Gossypium tomentosum]